MSHEYIKPEEFAKRLEVPTSWVYSKMGNRTPKDQRIPHAKFGRYLRLAWGSPELEAWLAKRRTGAVGDRA